MQKHRFPFLMAAGLIVAGCLATLSAACSQDSAQRSPSGPSAIAPAGTASFSGWASSGMASAALSSLAQPQGTGPKKKVAGAGTVAGLTGDCESGLSMVVNGVKVITDGATLFYIGAAEEYEGGCGNLRPGTKVLVKADDTPNADGSYTADSITILDQPGGKPPEPVAGEGTVGALKGECLALTLVVHGYPVMTTVQTDFGDAGATDDEAVCSAIRPGSKVSVTGLLLANSVVAETLKILAEPTLP